VVLAGLLAGCGEGKTPVLERVQDDPDAYALDVAEAKTGSRERAGCLSDTEVNAQADDYVYSEAAESNPGCVFSAAFAGCLEGQSGESSGVPGRHFTQEFPEPGLQRVYRQARRDCG
jgi:hypothetical protein